MLLLDFTAPSTHWAIHLYLEESLLHAHLTRATALSAFYGIQSLVKNIILPGVIATIKEVLRRESVKNMGNGMYHFAAKELSIARHAISA